MPSERVRRYDCREFLRGDSPMCYEIVDTEDVDEDGLSSVVCECADWQNAELVMTALNDMVGLSSHGPISSTDRKG